MLTSSAARHARRRRHRDHRRDPRDGRNEARRSSRAVARTARGGHGASTAADRPVGHAATARRGRTLPRRVLGAWRAAAGTHRRRRYSQVARDRGCRSRSRTWSTLGQPVTELRSGPATVALAERRTSIWPSIYPRSCSRCLHTESTIIFCNARRSAERIAAKLNELAVEQGVVDDGDPELVKAHHGSLAREQRVVIEDQLKRGELRAIVATSSLELGIDMGAVDLVVQVESPGAVSRGLQRIGRAGHSVGEPSRGTIFPKHRGDLLDAAVVTRRMVDGLIEHTHYLRNPLDVLAQQIVAHVAITGDVAVRDLATLVRRCANFAELSDELLHNVLDLLAGRYPSEEFTELRPRLVWDRVNDTVRARDGSKRLAVTSAAAPSPTAGCSVCSSPTAPASASSTKRWCTRAVRARRSCSAPRPGASRTSRSSGSPSRRHRASRARCRSGTAIAPAARSSSAARSVRSSVRSATSRRSRPPSGCATHYNLDAFAPATSCSTSTNRPKPRVPCPTIARSSSNASATRSATGGCASSARSARRFTHRGRWRSSAG